MLDPFQTGYRAGTRSQTSLLNWLKMQELLWNVSILYCSWSLILAKHSTLCAMSLLLRKLKILGLAKSALKSITSYLPGREQGVLNSEGDPSSFMPLNIGVSQGSVLGQLLFSLWHIAKLQLSSTLFIYHYVHGHKCPLWWYMRYF